MYELEEHLPHVADQIDGLSRRAWNDYEAALVFLLTRPFDADLIDHRAPGTSARVPRRAVTATGARADDRSSAG